MPFDTVGTTTPFRRATAFTVDGRTIVERACDPVGHVMDPRRFGQARSTSEDRNTRFLGQAELQLVAGQEWPSRGCRHGDDEGVCG